MLKASLTLLLEVILFSVLVDSDVNWRRIERCPFSEEDWKQQAKNHSCETKTQLKYHCMLDDKGNSIETCMAVREFKNGCPWIYVTPDGKLFPANTGTQCKGNIYCPTPEESFLTDQLYKYPACLVDESKRANFTLEVYVTSSPDENNRQNANHPHTQLQGWKVVIVVSLAVLLLGCVILIIVAYYRLRTDPREKETERDTEEGIDLIPKEGVVAIKPPEAMRGGENQKKTGKSEPITMNVEGNIHKYMVVQTEAIRRAKEKIKTNEMVILVGDIGSGKTTSFEDVCTHFLETAEWKWKVKTDQSFPKTKNDIETLSNLDRILICMDDCCGKYNTDSVKMDLIEKTLNSLSTMTKRGNGWKKVILTITCAQFNHVLSLQTKIDRSLLADCAVYLSQISADDKRDILEQYIGSKDRTEEENPGIDMMKTFGVDQSHSNLSVLGWPLICRLFAIPYIAQNIENFVENPFGTMVKGVESLKETNTTLYCGLIYMMLKGGTFDYISLDDECLGSILKLYAVLPEDHTISNMIIIEQFKSVPEYFKFKNGKLTFFHDIFTMAIFCSFYKMYPNYTIRLCDLQILADLFRPAPDGGSDCDGLALLARKYMEEYEKDQISMQPTTKGDDTTRENMDKKIQYRFTLSEENRDRLMLRILKENPHLFEGHPLFSNYTYKVL